MSARPSTGSSSATTPGTPGGRCQVSRSPPASGSGSTRPILLRCGSPHSAAECGRALLPDNRDVCEDRAATVPGAVATGYTFPSLPLGVDPVATAPGTLARQPLPGH